VRDLSFSTCGDGKKGVLLLHGMTGAPGEMRLVGRRLQRVGLATSAPLLAGHGQDKAALLRTSWRDWLDSAREGYRRLAAEVEEVYVAGICVGGALALALCAEFPQIKGAAVYSMTFEYDGWNMPRWGAAAPLIQLVAHLPLVRQISLEEPYPYLIVDARYEKVREDGAVRSQAVLIAIGINWEGRRNVLAVELAHRETASSWKELLVGLRKRSLQGVELVVSDDHAGLRRAIQEVLPEAVWQRCYVHFLRNALDYLPRKADDDCLMELRWIYDRRNLEEARQDLGAWLGKWGKRYPKLCSWVEDNIEETLSFYRLPRQHHKNLKSTNMLERLMEEIKRRTLVVRIFPNAAACLRLVRALAVEMHENWIEAMQYLNMEPLAEQKKEALRRMGDAA